MQAVQTPVKGLEQSGSPGAREASTPVYLTQQHPDAGTGSSGRPGARTHKYGMASLVAAVERHTPTTPTRPVSAPRARWASPVQPPPPASTATRTRPLSATSGSLQQQAHDTESLLPRKPNFTSLPQPAAPSLEYTSKPVGDPPITELNPKSASQQIRLKHRAATLIQRYAGSHWQAAQRTKWMLDVVSHIDKDYREYIMDQATTIQHLQQQIEMMQGSYGGALHSAQTKAAEVEEYARRLQSELRDSRTTILDLQTRLLESEAALGIAEQAANTASAEMAELHAAVSAIAEHDARTRKALANRAHDMREALRGSQARLRHSTEAARRGNVEIAAMLRLKDQQLATDKANLSAHFMSQIAAVHQVERAAAQVEVAKVKMELEAYKEPWVYAYKKKSPTTNKDVTAALGLQPTSLHTLIPT